MEIPAGQTGGPPLPADQRQEPGPNYRPRPRGMGASIGGFSPGNSIRLFPEGMAMRLPAGYSLVFQMHYTTTGKATTDRTRIGAQVRDDAAEDGPQRAALINGVAADSGRRRNHPSTPR